MDWSEFYERVSHCPHCGALVPDDEEARHREWHVTPSESLALRVGRAIVMLQDGVDRYVVIETLRTGTNQRERERSGG